MKELIDNILVVGHHNPDTDASASACAYAEFLNQINRYESNVIGAIPGELTPQARFVFECAKKQEPLVIENVSPLVGHVLTKDGKALDVSDRVGEAVEQLVRSDVSMLPVVENGKLHGIFSNRSDAARFLLGFDPTPLWGSLLQIKDLLSMPGMAKLNSVTVEDQLGSELRIAFARRASIITTRCVSEGIGTWKSPLLKFANGFFGMRRAECDAAKS